MSVISFEILNDRGHHIDNIVNKWSPFIRMKKTIKKININDAIKNSFEYYTAEIEEQDTEIIYPDPEENVVIVEMDYADVTIIFENLIRNSLYWINLTKINDPTIEVNVKEVGSKAYITFKDNGPGIDLQDFDKIFLPGWSMREDGQGLGLSIIGEIIDEYGGTIGVASPPEGETGAIFIIELPCVSGEDDDDE